MVPLQVYHDFTGKPQKESVKLDLIFQKNGFTMVLPEFLCFTLNEAVSKLPLMQN